MKKLLIPLLALVGLTACRSPARDPVPTNTATLNLATGLLTATDNSGQAQSAAGNSRIANIDSGVAVAFANKSDPTMELAWFDINRAAEDQPDVAIDLALANEHKSAVEGLKAITAGGNPTVAALNLATEGLKAVKDKIAAREREKAARGKADTSAFRATAFLQGPGAVTSVASMAGTMGSAVANGNQNRATLTSDISSKVTDISNTNDWQGASTILKHQLELAKINLEYERLKKANSVTPAKPPVVKPVEPVDPDDDGTPGEAPTSSVEYDKLPKKNFLYKTSGLSRGVAAILIPKDRPKPVSVTGIGGLRMIENYFSTSEDRHIMRFDGTKGNGPATVRVTYADGNTEAFNVKDLNGRTDYAPGAYKKPTSAEPVDPPPSTSSLFILEPDKLTLRPDFAAVVRNVDAVARNNEPQINPIVIPSGKVGPYTWGIPKPLGSYPKSETGPAGQKALPNTWRISLIPGVKIPADVTYHRSIMQSFIQDGATKTYPPTTRE